ncbi:hypothetical protein I2494_07665 [Budviciaceae bacterium BWR-B9]|uniref:DUF4304 domain-containing protein n=1 Tax=Limnobaculum allomyrinae TaxID=2791986 RepID=A0ABS1IPW3_9GAMM|nr:MULTISPECIES: hypothetical protein [Limnobaculum]MBK5143592.1 hypothetical protein [Limnobaculum allomyrinae]MBV7691480.1 hypothetical protein [Limnobaculum sp. M2-1]
MSKHENILRTLIDMFEKIYEELKITFPEIRKNVGGYEYKKDNFTVYISIFPNEIEVVAELSFLDGDYFLDFSFCNPEGAVLKEGKHIEGDETKILKEIKYEESDIKKSIIFLLSC